MNRRQLNRAALMVLLVAGSVWYRCTRSGGIAGGSGSTTTNGFTATVIDAQGGPVANATVHVRPEGYCASGSGEAVTSAGTVADTFTGTDGTVSLGAIQPGRYTIEAFDALTGQGVVIRSEIAEGPARDIGALTIVPVGGIRGALDAALLRTEGTFGVQIYGMERFSRVDSAEHTFFPIFLPRNTHCDC